MRLSLVSILVLGAFTALAGCTMEGSGPARAAASGTGGDGAGGEGGSGGAAGSGGGGGGVCEPKLSSVAPSGTDDVTYAVETELGCFGSPCLCAPGARDFVDRLLGCEPIAGGYFTEQGSVYVRVTGRQEGQCVLDVGSEVEGNVVAHRCRLSLPIEPWQGIASTADDFGDASGFLSGIAGSCELRGSCCIQDGCPSPCATTFPDVPLCPLQVGPSCM